MTRRLPRAPQELDLPAVEQAVLQFWDEADVFRRSVEQRASEREFVFYDGPPFANGLPHYGHLLTGFVKDAVPRWRAMQGDRVERRFGWDCHGLPAEMEAEKQLELYGRAAVLGFGVEQFNEHCRSSVLRYTAEWERYVKRQGRWVDFHNDYKTMDSPYMESVIWAFAELYRRGLIYQGNRVLPYCWECETPLSNFETRLDDSFRERVDPAVSVCFEALPSPTLGDGKYQLVAWTTTPWTLPSNLALAVDPHLDYTIVDNAGTRLILAEHRVGAYDSVLAGARRVGTIPGSDLVGVQYRPLFDYFADTPGAFRILAADLIDVATGTGIVHMAPAFGEDDQRLCEEAGIQLVNPVDERGRFTSLVHDLSGQHVFAANDEIVQMLAGGLDPPLLKVEQYAHPYPHCWRTDTPLIYRAQSGWFVAVSDHRGELLRANESINWVPDHIKEGAFGDWLAGARDWSVSRNRFWGSPIPVWVSDDPKYPRTDVYGSIDELERDFGVRPTDLHRPAIDSLTRPNPDDPTGGSTMRRVEDVLDVWFDSGAMPFAQAHYPFERRQWFDRHHPSDFIVEYIGQTRGWFYTLHVLSTLLFGRPAFRNAVVHGVLLGDDGRKMSKRLRNYPEPDAMFDKYGADVVRWFMLSSPVLAGRETIVSENGIAEVVRRVISPIWNAWYFLTLYADADDAQPVWRTDAASLLDRFLLARTRRLIEDLSVAMDRYDLHEATRLAEDHLDVVNNWWIRRSRGRFWRSEQDDDKADAYDTLYTCLEVFLRLTAPLLPMLTDHIWRELTGGESVHLTDAPDPACLPRDEGIIGVMEQARAVCAAAHAIRVANNLRVRQPLASLTVQGADAGSLVGVRELIAAEVNVKEVVLSAGVPRTAESTLEVDPRRVGPRLGPAVQQVLRAAKGHAWRLEDDGRVEVAGEILHPDEYRIIASAGDDPSSRSLPHGDVVTLDLTLTQDLVEEGLVRDVIRLIQNIRREADLAITARIHVDLEAPDDVNKAVERYLQHVGDVVLADEVHLLDSLAARYTRTLPDGRAIGIRVYEP